MNGLVISPSAGWGRGSEHRQRERYLWKVGMMGAIKLVCKCLCKKSSLVFPACVARRQRGDKTHFKKYLASTSPPDVNVSR
eukprot:753916-Hanusia_phi.AAC.1